MEKYKDFRFEVIYEYYGGRRLEYIGSLYEEARETGAYKLELDIPIGAPGINIHWAGAKC